MKINLLVILFIVIIFAGCQAVFTYSPFSIFQRDPAKLPPEQQIAWAESVLASGDTDSMAEAYELLEALLEDDPDNGELNLLAADLAIGASGLGDLLSSIDLESGTDTLSDALDSLNYEYLDAVGDHIAAAAESGTEVSESQYVNASAAIVAGEANEAGGFDNVDWENPSEDLQTALDYAELGNVDIESYFSSEEGAE